jgi:hypothetical protein
MIIIDRQAELAKYLDSVDMSSIGGVKLDEASFELARKLDDELAIVHAQIYTTSAPNMMAKLEALAAIVLFDPKGEVQHFYPNTIAVVNQQTQASVLKNLVIHFDEILREKLVLRSQLYSINQELSEIMGNVEVEMMRVKKMYEMKTPRRFQDIKGVQVYSKYSAGENIGGEFFDIFMDQNKLFVLMTSTTSYLASSSILNIFSQFKQKNRISAESEVELIENIKNEVKTLNQNKKKQIELEIFTAVLDLNKHIVNGHLFGNFHILSSASNSYYKTGPNVLESEISKGKFSRSIERGERILLSSPGFIKNWEKHRPQFLIEEIINNKKIKPLDLLDEIFFQLKKDSTSGFLSFDASAIILEVQPNAMVQV